MSATTLERVEMTRPRTTAYAPPARLRDALHFELAKSLAQWRTRILIVACWIAPAVLVALVSAQRSLPVDTVFGRWMGQSGWAGPLVVLSFSGSWVLPLAASLVFGDVFAAEDRVGTWQHLLVAIRSPRRIFAAKVVAGVGVLLVMVIGLAASSVIGGLVAVGNETLVGLGGQPLSPSHAAGDVLLAWASALAPALAFAAVGVLGSVVFGRSPIGLVTPALLALAMQTAQMLPLPVAVRVALPSYGFTSWHGIFTEPVQTAPVVVGLVVALAWTAAAALLAYRMFLRRNFTDPDYDGAGRGAVTAAVLSLAGLLAATVAVVATTIGASGSGIDRPQLEASLARAYAHLYRLQTGELHRPAVTEQKLRTSASCDKGGGLESDSGPGNDWRCVVTWHLGGTGALGSAVYQLDVAADGRFVADGDGPQQVNGFFQIRTPQGDEPNPLWQFDGSVNLLSRTTSKG